MTAQTPATAKMEKWPGSGPVFHKFLTPDPVSSEISDLTPCTHAQSNTVHTKNADKTDY